MKFFCDNCQAQYMISDEKVGPAGVRVRCKKCGHVIYVKRLDAEQLAPEDATVVMTVEKMAELGGLEGSSLASVIPIEAPNSTAPTAKAAGGLEEEIGQALDSMFSDGPTLAAPGSIGIATEVLASGGSRLPIVIGAPRSQAPLPVASPGGSGQRAGDDSDRAETRIFTATDMEKIAADMSMAPANGSSVGPKPIEWFIAVRDEQVGPLKVAEIKERFELGEVGTDTLVWSTGLTDWRPLSTVEELAELIIPKREITRSSRAPVPSGDLPTQTPQKDQVAFKPSAASALASLASMAKEEIASSAKSKLPSSAAPAAARAGVGAHAASPASDLLVGMPSPSPDLTLPHQTQSAYTSSYQNEQRRGPVADYQQSPLAQSRPQRPASDSTSNRKVILMVIIGAIAFLGVIGAGAYFFVIKPQGELSAQLAEQRAKDAEVRAAAEKAAAEAAAAKAAQVPPPVPTPPPTAVAVAPVPQPATPPHASASEISRDRHPKAHRGGAGGKEVAEAAPAKATASAVSEKVPAKASDDFLAAGDVDKEFARELDGAGEAGKVPTKHAPYIPPPPGQGDLPVALSTNTVVFGVSQHRDAFAKCVQDQKRRDPTSTGTVVMRWRIKPDGRVTDIGAKSADDADSPLAGCFKGQIGKLHFPSYSGPQMQPIEFPFSF